MKNSIECSFFDAVVAFDDTLIKTFDDCLETLKRKESQVSIREYNEIIDFYEDLLNNQLKNGRRGGIDIPYMHADLSSLKK